MQYFRMQIQPPYTQSEDWTTRRGLFLKNQTLISVWCLNIMVYTHKCVKFLSLAESDFKKRMQSFNKMFKTHLK